MIIKMQTSLLILIVMSVLLLFLAFRKEKFVRPWDVEDCEIACFESGQPSIGWNHGRVDGAWNDPAAQPNSTFNVPKCLDLCRRPPFF